jgi:hypothetical protein
VICQSNIKFNFTINSLDWFNPFPIIHRKKITDEEIQTDELEKNDPDAN